MLHARELCFIHPETRKKIILKAPIPDDMKYIIKNYFPLLEAFDAL